MVISSGTAIIGILLSVISTILLGIATAMPGWYFRETITFGMWVYCEQPKNHCHQIRMSNIPGWVHGWRAMLIMATIASAAAAVCGLISLRNISVKKWFNFAAIGINFSSGLFDFTGILLVASEVHYHFNYSFGLACLGGIISLIAGMLMILKHNDDKKCLQHVNNANQVQMIPMMAGNQVQMVPMMAGNQVEMIPMMAGNQVQMIPIAVSNQTQMVPVNAGNQLQMSPIVSGDQVQMAPMTAVNQVQMAPMTAVNQVQMAPMTAGNQIQVTPTTPGKKEQMTLEETSIQM